MKKVFFILSLTICMFMGLSVTSFAATRITPITRVTTNNGKTLIDTPWTTNRDNFSGGGGSFQRGINPRGGFFSGDSKTDTTSAPSSSNLYYVNINGQYQPVTSITYQSSNSVTFVSNNQTYTAIYNDYEISYTYNNQTYNYVYNYTIQDNDIDIITSNPSFNWTLRHNFSDSWNKYFCPDGWCQYPNPWEANSSGPRLEMFLADGKGNAQLMHNFNFDLYDYYVTISACKGVISTGIIDLDYLLYNNPTTIKYLPSDYFVSSDKDKLIEVTDYTSSGWYFTSIQKDPTYYPTSTFIYRACDYTFKLDVPISALMLDYEHFSGQLPSDLNFVKIVIYRVPIDRTIGGGTDLSGDNDTPGIIAGGDSGLNEFNPHIIDFNNAVDNYLNFENGVISDFQISFDGIGDSFNTFNLDTLNNANVFLSTTMESMYNSMDSFKFYIILPMLLGVALIFIGGGHYRD